MQLNPSRLSPLLPGLSPRKKLFFPCQFPDFSPVRYRTQLRLKSKDIKRIGTDDPQGLANALLSLPRRK